MCNDVLCLVEISASSARVSVRPSRRSLTDSKTYKRLGYDPISLDEGLQITTGWLREIEKIS